MARQSPKRSKSHPKKPELVRLNKILSNAGLGNRKEMDLLIQKGRVKVNGRVINQLGKKIALKDEIQVDDKIIVRESPIFILLNKPKGMASSFRANKGKISLKDISALSDFGRLFVISPLSIQSRGLIVLTNNRERAGELSRANKISHLLKIELEDAFDKQKIPAFVEAAGKEDCHIKKMIVNESNDKVIGMELYGTIAPLQALFQSYQATVIYMDRQLISGLTKKNLARGHWRKLTDREMTSIMKLT